MKIPRIIQQPLSMILLVCTICARVKCIQYNDICHKGAGSQRPPNRLRKSKSHAIKIFWHVQPFYSKTERLFSGFNHLSNVKL